MCESSFLISGVNAEKKLFFILLLLLFVKGESNLFFFFIIIDIFSSLFDNAQKKFGFYHQLSRKAVSYGFWFWNRRYLWLCWRDNL